jgi:hypothetical protein
VRRLVDLFFGHIGVEDEPDGPELDAHRRLPVCVVDDLRQLRAGHAWDHARHVDEQLPDALGASRDLEGVL